MTDHLARLDLNCDLAEGEPPELTAALLAEATSANVACAVHAGSLESVRHTLDLGRTFGVHLGAHPGLPGNFGRAPADGLTPDAFVTLLHDQIHRFFDLAAATGVTLHHVKLHGALYHATEHDPALREAFVRFLTSHTPHAIVYALAGGTTVAAARAAGLTAWDEAFADRAYQADGSLVPRHLPGALLTDPTAVAERVIQLARRQPIHSLDGTPLLLQVQTVCLHSDSPNSLALLQAARHALRR